MRIGPVFGLRAVFGFTRSDAASQLPCGTSPARKYLPHAFPTEPSFSGSELFDGNVA